MEINEKRATAINKEVKKFNRMIQREALCNQPKNSQLECMLDGVSDRIVQMDQRFSEKFGTLIENQEVMLEHLDSLLQKLEKIDYFVRNPDLSKALNMVKTLTTAANSKSGIGSNWN